MPLYLALLTMGGISVDKQDLHLSDRDAGAYQVAVEQSRPAAEAAAERKKQRVQSLLSRAKRQSYGG